jgi:hypothetical protein
MRQFDDIDETDIPFATFNSADVVSVQVCAVCKLLLCKATPSAEPYLCPMRAK